MISNVTLAVIVAEGFDAFLIDSGDLAQRTLSEGDPERAYQASCGTAGSLYMVHTQQFLKFRAKVSAAGKTTRWSGNSAQLRSPFNVRKGVRDEFISRSKAAYRQCDPPRE